MKKTIITLISILTFTTCFSQIKYDPRILILSPNEMIYDKVFDKEISKYNAEIKNRQLQQNEQMNPGELEKQPENVKIMVRNEDAFSKTLDFSKQISSTAEQYLVYSFIERCPNLLITLKDIKCNGDIAALKSIATEQQFQYILNFPKINFYKEGGISKAKVFVQLYNQNTNTLLLDKELRGDWKNQGFEFSCEDSTLNCTISNALSKVLPEIIEIIATASPTLQKEKLLTQQRSNTLINDYYSKPLNPAFLRNIIPPTDSNINFKSLYQCLVDESKSKFIAFFASEPGYIDLKTLNKNGRDNDVHIISNTDMKNPTFPNEVPQTYAYIVKGVKYKNKWYYQKSSVTYFEAKDIKDGQQRFFNLLQEWNFFKEGSTDFNPDFWETNQFNKVTDLTKEPQWPEYGKTIWEAEEREHRGYIGMYEIVATELIKAKAEENRAFNKSISDETFKPFYHKQKQLHPDEFNDYNLLKEDEFTLIYPENKTIILNPIQIVDSKGGKQIRYFLLFKKTGQIFEWTYFVQHPYDETTITEHIWHYGSVFMSQLETITHWNFAFETLDDQNFWNKYVLAKTGEQYKYLRLIK